MEASPSPLSSRAQPRDLQFYRPVLEMYSEDGVWTSRPVGPTANVSPARQEGPLSIDSPTLSERRRRRHIFTSTCVSTPSKNISRKGPRTCRSLGCARDDKGEGVASMESGYWTEGVFHLLRWAASGLRPIYHGMTKGRVVLPSGFVAGGENRRSPFDFAQGRFSTALRSGRDDNSYFGRAAGAQERLSSQ